MFRFAAILGLLAVTAGLATSGVLRDASGKATYITAPVKRGDVVTTLSATGRLSALVTVSVGSQLSGQVAELHADFNQNVLRGEVLARLDPRSFQARAREAEAALQVGRVRVDLARAALEGARLEVEGVRQRLAEAEALVERAQVVALDAERSYGRALTLKNTLPLASVENSETGALSASADLKGAEARRGFVEQQLLVAEAGLRGAVAEVRHAEAAVEQQAAVVEQALLDLERSVIVSPIDGVIISRDVNVGQTVAASFEAPTLFTIAQDLRKMQVLAAVDEADISRVRIGQMATFTVDAYPSTTFAATVIDIYKAPRDVQNVVAYTVVLEAENPNLSLLPGMTAIVQMVTERANSVIKVPNAALLFHPTETAPAARGDDGSTIWLLSTDGTAVPQRVKIGRMDTTGAEVLEGGLEIGTEVILGTASPPAEPSLLARLLGA